MNPTSHPCAPRTMAAAAAPAVPSLGEAAIAICVGEHRFLLDDGRGARQAMSCLIAPEPGDRVLVAACAGGECYVLHVLRRAEGADCVSSAGAELSVPGAAELRIRQDRLSFHARDELTLHSLRDVAVSAATGLLSLHADHMFNTVNQTLVQSTRYYVGSAEQYLLDASDLLRLQGRQTLVGADQDVKVDAERISVG